MNMETVSADRTTYLSAMRKVPSAVAVVSMNHQGCRGGLTATAVCSVSADPPQILVCVNKAGRSHESMRAAEFFGVNFLAQNHEAVARSFSTPSAPEERFAGAQWVPGGAGVPLLADALVAFECRMAQAIDCGTHTIFIGRITEVRQREERALIYKSGEFLTA